MTTDGLTPRERLIRAVRGETVDRPPCICPGGMMNMVVEETMDLSGRSWPAAHSDAEAMADLAAAQYENGGFENFGVPFCMTVEAESLGAQVSLGDRIHEPRVTRYCIENCGQWRRLKELDPSQGRPATVCRAVALLRRRNPDVPVVANLTGPISLASSLVDPVVFYKEMRRRPEDVTALMTFVSDQLIRFGRAQLRAGADILTISDPSGTGEILGPQAFADFALPALNRILTALAPLARGTIVHICGRLISVAEELKQLRCDCISFDSITSARALTAAGLPQALMGNVSTLGIETASPEHLKAMAENCLRQGVAVLSPACGIGARTALSQVRVLVNTARAHEKKPGTVLPWPA